MAEDLNHLKVRRTSVRGQSTKLCNKIESFINDQNSTIEGFEALLEQVIDKIENLRDLNNKIENLISVDDLESDMNDSEEYNSKLILYKHKLSKVIKDLKPENHNDYNDTVEKESQNSVSQVWLNQIKPKLQCKLPKLMINKYFGCVTEFQSFWSQFESSIHKNETLSAIEKFNYLKSLCGGVALNAINGLELTEENYESAINILTDRFGRKDLIINAHMNKLLNLEAVKYSSDTFKLRKLYDEIKIHVRSLENLKVTSGSYGSLLCPILLKLLPNDLNLAFNRHRKTKSEICLNELLEFIEQEVQCREASDLVNEFKKTKPSEFQSNPKFENKHSDRPKNYSKFPQKNYRSNVSTAVELLTPHEENVCLFCKSSEHKSESCSHLNVNEKKDLLKKQGRCFICLGKKHIFADCQNKKPCSFCSKMHNVTLCYKKENCRLKESNTKSDNITNTVSNHVVNGKNKILLQTASVELIGKESKKNIRVVFDGGAQRTYIKRDIAKLLSLPCVGKEELLIHTFQSQTPRRQVCSRIEVKIKNKCNGELLKIEALEIDEITQALLDYPDSSVYKQLQMKGIILADVDESSACERDISMLIGADYYWKIVTGKTERLSDKLVAAESKFGWILMGRMDNKIESEQSSSALAVTSMFVHSSNIENLWKLDTIGIRDPVETKSRKEMEDAALAHFKQTITINDEGRYEIKLPWVENKEGLKTNLDVAERRCKSTTNKLIRKRGFLDYEAVFDEWLHEDVIEDVPFEELEFSCHYLPHRGVYKENSTTKIRPVFDASCRGVESPSLNDFLEKGPNLLEQIPPILIRFRRDKIGVTSDIRKAFLQISVSKIDRDYLRFLWWKDFEKQIFRTYRHKRVVFGLNCSPFLLAAVLNYHIETNSSQFQETCDILKNSFYVDNLVTSVPDERKLQNFIQESTYLLKLGCFDLRGWEHTTLKQENRSEKPVPVLGLLWDKVEDVLFCNVRDIDLQLSGITRRSMLSTVHKIFDTIGVLCPTTLVPKLILQKSWDLKIGWDEVLPDEYQNEFKSWMKDIPLLSDVRISRCLNVFDSKELSLHTFCDGSKHAYSAVVFLRIVHNSDVKIHLIQAKARVTPLRKITIPRIELLACCIGARLASSVLQALNLENISCFYWSDSSTALTWIKKEDHWGVFVGNRVQEIRKLTHKDCWKHIPSAFNAADLASRGCSIRTLVRSKWWLGPDWLKGNEDDWPSTEMKLNEEEIQSERRKHILQAINCSVPDERWYLRYFSKYGRILRMVAWILRFINNCKGSSSKLKRELTVPEIETAEKKICRLVQAEMFEKDVRLKGLCTFIDPDGLIRLKTKITRLDDEEYFRCPIVLPSDHDLTRRLIIDCHLQLSHAGVQFVLARIRQKFWILRGRKTVQRVLSRCVRCKKYNAKGVETVPAPLPEDRIREALVFEVIGVDVAGPLYLKKEKKAWILLFTCAVYRAVHLELIESLSTNGFFLGLRRFIARRGRPRIIYSDNGTNFIGADNLLRSIDWNQIECNLSTLRIQWKFNPPTGSWWGGWWERLIQMVKKLLRNVLGKSCLSYEEMSTILCDVESTINSRPLTYLSEDPDDLTPLTPLMFIQDVHNVGVPDLDHLDSVNLTKRYRFTQTLKEHFRRRFRDEYLALLVQKPPKRRTGMIKKNDLVFVSSDNKKRIDWPIGRVTEVYPGKDGEIRVVKVKTATGEITRPVKRLFPLELDDENYFSDLTKNRKDSPTECDNIEIYKTRHGRKTVKPSKYF